jgi:hypothetical protein
MLFCQDDRGRPCSREDAYLWTWAGASRWYYVSVNPVPTDHPVDGTRWDKKKGAGRRAADGKKGGRRGK